MQVPVKIFIPIILTFSIFVSFLSPVRADNLNDAITEYNYGNYKKSIKLLKEELEKNPNNIEIYKWLAKSYEGLFEIEEALNAYNKYEMLKKERVAAVSSITPLPSITPLETQSVTPIPSVEPIKETPYPTLSPIPLPSSSALISPIPPLENNITPIPSLSPTVIPSLANNKNNNKVAVKPEIKPTPKVVQTPKPTPTPKKELLPMSDGWDSINVVKITKVKTLHVIPPDSLDLMEEELKADENEEFVILECNIKYSKDILIKRESNQISLVDSEGKKYNLYALSTYIFRYKNDDVPEKVKTLMSAKYYQLSQKDYIKNITMVFKVPNDNKLIQLSIVGYKDINIKSFNA